jgi:hypothetical protein
VLASSGVSLASRWRRTLPISLYPAAADIESNMDELADGGSMARDLHALRRRPVGDGYLFFRGLLPATQVPTAARAVIAQLCRDGWSGYSPA